MAGDSLRAAAEGGDRALTLVVVAERGHERQAAAAFFFGRAAHRLRRDRGLAAGARDVRGPSSSSSMTVVRPATPPLMLAEALARFLLGLALCFFFRRAAGLFVAFAGFGGLAVGALDGVARGAALRLFLGGFALLGLAHARVDQRLAAGVPFFLGERAQHDAGRLRRRRGFRRAAGFAAGAAAFGLAAAAAARAGARFTRSFAAFLSPPGAMVRRLTVSTTTDLERPWLKLWRTTPCSTLRFTVSVFGDERERFFAYLSYQP